MSQGYVFLMHNKFCDVHSRFMLSLTSCRSCMVIDDQFNVLPFSSHSLNVQPLPAKSLVGEMSNVMRKAFFFLHIRKQRWTDHLCSNCNSSST